jgi:hypothetical protein
MQSTRRRLLAVAVATGAVALAAPVSGASAQVPGVGFPVPSLGTTATAVGGNQIGGAVCVGTNRPTLGGNNGSTSAQSCGGLGFQGPHIGQIGGDPGFGPTLINSPFTEVYVSSGSITEIGP